MPDQFPRVTRPCAECPWRQDTEPGQFTLERYEALESTVGRPGEEVPIGGPIFSCHKTPETTPRACAGWLAVVGDLHLHVRLAVATRAVPAEALSPRPGWPPLFDSYAELVARQANREGRP